MLQNPKIMFSAGEPSGDLHGESLAKAVRELAPDAELVGFGGPKMEAAGVRLCSDMREYTVMGVVEVVLNLRRILGLLNKLCEFMEREKPDILVLIDYPDFNWRLAARAKAMGIPVFSYIPPSAWAWRKGRAKKCSAIADELAAIFPFELPVYKEAGANITFQGNPLIDTVKSSMSKDEARKHFNVPDGKVPVILIPGSRRQEINMLLPSMLEAAIKLQSEHPELEFYLPIAPGIDRKLLQSKLDLHKNLNVHLTTDCTYDLMNIGKFALATSGTVVLEAAIMGLPCIVLYRMAKLNYMIGKLLVDITYFSLPNLLLNRQIQPELLQDEVNTERIFKEANRFLEDSSYLLEVKSGLAEAVCTLGAPNAARRVASRILAAAEKYSKRK